MAAPARTWLLLPAGLSLLAGLDAGLILLGVPAPVGSGRLPDVHGVLMVLGFLGTLISLERAVALRQGWAYAAPMLLGAGGLALAAPLPRAFGAILLIDGTAALVAVLATLWRRQRDEMTAVEVLGAVCALCAALLWTRLEVAALLPWLVSFIILTIAAERVELARILLPGTAPRTLVGMAVLFVAAPVSALLVPAIGARMMGVVLVVMAVWLGIVDVARRTIRGTGQARLSAVAMLAAYVWLTVAGLTWVVTGPPTTTATYDVVVHGVFLGFAMSMVVAHAPVILPAVIRTPLPYRSIAWLPLVVLHVGLLVRVAGDVGGQGLMWQAGGVVTVIALLLLPASVIASLLLPAPTRARPAPATQNVS